MSWIQRCRSSSVGNGNLVKVIAHEPLNGSEPKLIKIFPTLGERTGVTSKRFSAKAFRSTIAVEYHSYSFRRSKSQCVLQTFPNEFPVFVREHWDGMYRSDVYFLCKTMADVSNCHSSFYVR